MAESKTFTVSFDVTTTNSRTILGYMVVKALSHLIVENEIGEFTSLTLKEKNESPKDGIYP